LNTDKALISVIEEHINALQRRIWSTVEVVWISDPSRAVGTSLFLKGKVESTDVKADEALRLTFC
jgi:hypothetical protein